MEPGAAHVALTSERPPWAEVDKHAGWVGEYVLVESPYVTQSGFLTDLTHDFRFLSKSDECHHFAPESGVPDSYRLLESSDVVDRFLRPRASYPDQWRLPTMYHSAGEGHNTLGEQVQGLRVYALR